MSQRRMKGSPRKVAADYRARQLPDVWLTLSEVAAVCPSCASRMAASNLRGIKASVLFGEAQGQTRRAERWRALPEGWTSDSLKKFWKSLTGDAKHKVTACIRKMEGKVDDAGAFCAAARDRVEGSTRWRSER